MDVIWMTKSTLMDADPSLAEMRGEGATGVREAIAVGERQLFSSVVVVQLEKDQNTCPLSQCRTESTELAVEID